MTDMQHPHQSSADLAKLELPQAQQLLQRMQTEIGKVVVGQQAVVDQVLIALLAAGHVLIEGVPGLGKTLLVRSLAEVLSGRHQRIQFTPDLMPADVTGHAMLKADGSGFVVRRGPVFTHLLLADEINRAPAKTQSALLEVMQEWQVTIEGKTYPVPRPFMVLATQNPLEQEGTYPLPEAELDRFLFKIQMDYPALEDELALTAQVTQGRDGAGFYTDAIEACMTPETVGQLQAAVTNILVDQAVLDYAVRIVRSSREWPGVVRGAGPRASIALVRAARAQALLLGRDFVLPEDVYQIAPAVLRHRLALGPQLLLEGVEEDQVIQQLLQQVAAPRQ